MLKLYIGNKNYSSWSMRPWVLLKQLGIPFEEVMIRFDDMAETSPFKQAIRKVSPTGRVPALLDGDLVLWDSLAIVEHLAERFPDKGVWPSARAARAQARCACAEIHAGFSALRNACGMNIEASLPQVGAIVLRDQAGVRADLARMVELWTGLLQQHGGPMLLGAFSAADAYFAPVCMRIRTYALPVPPQVQAYVDRVVALPGVRAWIDDALQEQDFVVIDEPYRMAR
jgi:glutathione S-transferase